MQLAAAIAARTPHHAQRSLGEAFARANNRGAVTVSNDGEDDKLTDQAEDEALEETGGFHSVATRAPSALELAELEALDCPPPAPPRKRKPTPRVGSGHQTHDSWQCSECGYNTGRASGWHQRKWTHIHQQHADIAEELSRHEAKALLVPWSPACLWKCPVPGCGHGLLADDAGRARNEHGKEAHPEVDLKDFNLKAPDNSSAKATVAKRNKAAASRVQSLQLARDAGHSPEWLGYPSPNADQKHLIYRVFCTSARRARTRRQTWHSVSSQSFPACCLWWKSRKRFAVLPTAPSCLAQSLRAATSSCRLRLEPTPLQKPVA